GAVPDPSQAVVEPADRVQGVPAERHVGADEVPHRRRRRWHPEECATDDPVELWREPWRALPRPDRRSGPTATDDRGIPVAGGKAFQPLGLRPGIVVKECDDVADRMGDAGVASPGEPPATAVGDDDELW